MNLVIARPYKCSLRDACRLNTILRTVFSIARRLCAKILPVPQITDDVVQVDDACTLNAIFMMHLLHGGKRSVATLHPVKRYDEPTGNGAGTEDITNGFTY